jgi:hypothetical protein
VHPELDQQLNRIAWTQHILRDQLFRALQASAITPAGQALTGGHPNMAALWTAEYGDKFFDMGTMIRLGSAVEGCFKSFYMHKKGHKNRAQLQADAACKKGVFQRVQAWQSDSVIVLYRKELGVDLTTNPHLTPVQELMTHRHLYAHASGLIDDDYIEQIKKITGQDLLAIPEIAKSYPTDDLYWFEPLRRLPYFLDEARAFFAAFP